jgi:dTDP-4-amino-4,6-dideoxygalactose transaminase
MTTLTWDRHRGHAHTYDVVALGHNYRMDEIRSALGLAQLHKLEKNNARRKELTARYREGFKAAGFTGVEVPFADTPGNPSCHIMPVLLPAGVDRRLFMDAMRKAGIQTSIHYPPIHHFSYHKTRYPGISLPVTETVAAREVTLPLYPTMRDEDVDYILSTALEAFAAARSQTPSTAQP